MKIWSRIVGIIYIIAGVFLSLFFLIIWAAEAKDVLSIATTYIQNNISAFGIIGIVLVAIGALWVVNWFDYIYRTKVVSFENPGGKIKISLRAIEDYISSMLLKQMPGIRSLKARTALSSRGLETRIALKLYANLNIPEICSKIQSMTKDYLQDAVGIERISNIEVFVTSIKSNGQKRKENGEIKSEDYEEEDIES